jgi:hypothetical protein
MGPCGTLRYVLRFTYKPSQANFITSFIVQGDDGEERKEIRFLSIFLIVTFPLFTG